MPRPTPSPWGKTVGTPPRWSRTKTPGCFSTASVASRTSIARRGSELSGRAQDGVFRRWTSTASCRAALRGSGILERTQFFAQVARQRLETYYPDSTSRPDHLVHVSCTGYISPSAAQSLVNKRGWSGKTAVTHAYHMGCYASIPAIRAAAGLLALPRNAASPPSGSTSFTPSSVHCIWIRWSTRPSKPWCKASSADGHVRYSCLARATRPSGRKRTGPRGPGVHEYIVPGTESSMSWQTADWGMKMTLSRDVPRQVGDALPGSSGSYRRPAHEPSGLSLEEASDAAVFAVHPGGPKIIDFVQDKLKLQDAQVRQSADKCSASSWGNMSSATLPHVWKADPRPRPRMPSWQAS